MQRRDRQGRTRTRPSGARAYGRPPPPRAARGRPGAAGAVAARGRTHGGRPAAWRGGSSSSAEVVRSPPPSCCAPPGFANRAPAISGSAWRGGELLRLCRRRLASGWPLDSSGTGRERGTGSASRGIFGWVWARSVPPAKGSLPRCQQCSVSARVPHQIL